MSRRRRTEFDTVVRRLDFFHRRTYCTRVCRGWGVQLLGLLEGEQETRLWRPLKRCVGDARTEADFSAVGAVAVAR